MNIKTYRKALLVFLVALAGFKINYGQGTNTEKSKNNAELQNLIDSKNYVFVAQTALPIGRRAINLTSPYDLKVSGDTVVSDLPYFGRAFVAPMDPAEGGIHFTTANVSYSIKDRKKGGWEIAILPKDAKDVRQLFLTVSEDGYASLQVTSNNRQSIGYNGYITGKNTNK